MQINASNSASVVRLSYQIFNEQRTVVGWLTQVAR